MEKNGQIYCDGCHLGILKQPHRTLARKESATAPARTLHFHNRDEDDCWAKALAEAKKRTATSQMSFEFAQLATKAVIQ